MNKLTRWCLFFKDAEIVPGTAVRFMTPWGERYMLVKNRRGDQLLGYWIPREQADNDEPRVWPHWVSARVGEVTHLKVDDWTNEPHHLTGPQSVFASGPPE